MANPLVIEKNFQTLKQSLKLISSSRLRILRIVEFIEDLLNTPSFFPAYAIELVQQFSNSIIATDFTGTNPNLIKRCLNILEHISKDFPNLENDKLLKQAKNHLLTENEKLQTFLNSKNSHRLKESSHKKFEVGSVWIPMVEREQFLTAASPSFASLQTLNIEALFSRKETDADKLHIKQLSHKEESHESELLRTAEAARYLLGKFSHIKNGERVTINCSFKNPSFVEGQSLQAGLAAGLFTEFLRLHQHKEEYALRDDVAITGRIDKKANLLPVDEGALKLKVEACYFSHIKYLVVPKEQVGVCQSTVEKLTVDISLQESSNLKSPPDRRAGQISNSPRPSFEVIGISNLEEIFFNRRLTDSQRISIAKQTARNIWKIRRTIAAVVLTVLLLIIGKMLYGPIDKNPVTYDAEGETIFLKNKYGEIVDKILVGSTTIATINVTERDGLTNRFVSLFDINGDNINEVIYPQQIDDSRLDIAHVFCKDIIKDTVLWDFKVQRKLKFPYHPYVSSKLFWISNIGAGDHDNDGRSEIYVQACHISYFPGLLIKLDAISGEKISEYVNIGQFLPMEFVDIDSDGVTEVILGGANNSYDMAAVAILDSRFVQGHSPFTRNYNIEEIKPGMEKAYLLIPRTIVGNYFRYEERQNNVFGVSIRNSEYLIDVGIRDCSLPSNKTKSAEYIVQIGYDLKVKVVGTANSYDVLARQLYEEGKINRQVDAEYFEEYKKEILYWDGEKFVNYPTFNKKYLEMLKEKGLPLPKMTNGK